MLTIRPSIQSKEIKGKPVLHISVTPQQGLISYKGRYYTRVGSTNQQLSPEQMAQRVLQMSGQTWDATLTPWGLDSIDAHQVERFLRPAKDRLPLAKSDEGVAGTLQKLNLIRDGKLTAAAALLLTSEPQRLFHEAKIMLGWFQGNTILDSHILTGSLCIFLIYAAISQLRNMLDIRFDITVEEASLEGFQRQEIWTYPLEAIREALLNAIIHRDYTVLGNVEIRVYDDRLVSGSGKLAPHLEQFYEPIHPSIRRNPLIAEVFYYASLIERWGTGTTRIVQLCTKRGLPTPIFEEYSGGIRTTLFQDRFAASVLDELGLSKRQIKAVQHGKENGQISNKQYREIVRPI